ncbi:MAG: dienelactone hydrolase family protein [Caldilineaceae bacterium]|nr:dienelactone hydrolase family protein [Caldilineaceae bacterium]
MDRIYVMELVRSFQIGMMTRREFTQKATAALGSLAAANLLLAACQPVTREGARPVVEPESEGGMSESMDTPVEGLITENVEYEDADGETLMGYLARPEGADPLPGIVVIQEWWGLNEHIKDVTRRFAEQGYVALSPDLYKGVVATEPDEARKLVMELDMEEAVREIQRAIGFLLEQEYVAGEEAGIVGFCMGGRLVLMTAIQAENLGAAVAFYGSPLEPAQVPDVSAPLLGLYGSEDGGIPVEAVNTMEAALADAGIEHEIHIYGGAQHAFFNDTRASSYDADAAADAWERTLAWFSTHLG